MWGRKRLRNHGGAKKLLIFSYGIWFNVRNLISGELIKGDPH
jgi:hypothetical protein